MKLHGKVALITGGSRGIGKAIAAAFVREGARVAILARTTSEVESTAAELSHSGRVLGFTCDVSEEGQVHRVVKAIGKELGPVEILVNNAAVQPPIGPMHESDPQVWWKTVKSNLFGTFLCCHAVLPSMIERRRGRIINFSGGGGLVPRPLFSAYAVSKAAIVRLTENLAHEVRQYNIQVNAIAPGPNKTRMTHEVVEAGLAAGAEELAHAQKRLAEGGIPPEWPAALAVFLASSESDGITGRVISAVHDNWPKWPEHLKELADSELYTLRRLDPFTLRKVIPGFDSPLERR